jgi:hypothetical protein
VREFCFSTLTLTATAIVPPSIRFAAQRRIENSLPLQELVLFRAPPPSGRYAETTLQRESLNSGHLAIFELGCRDWCLRKGFCKSVRIHTDLVGKCGVECLLIRQANTVQS